MIIKSKTKIGAVEYDMEFEEKDEMTALHHAITLSNPPRYCNAPGDNPKGQCGNSQFFEMDARQVASKKDNGTYIYISIRCKKCGAKATLGQHASGGLYFWKQFERYEKSESEEPPTPEEQS